MALLSFLTRAEPMRAGSALLMLLAVACSSQAPTSSPATAPSAVEVMPTASPRLGTPAIATDVLRIAWADSGYPTPWRVSTSGPGGAVLMQYLYDTLTWKDEKGIIPWLADRWTISGDGLDYTFVMNPNAKWHDGKPVTAEDVAFSYTTYIKQPYRWMQSNMVTSATASGSEVRFRLSRPYAAFLEDVAGVVPIVPKHVWEKVTDLTTYNDKDAFIGSGPFTLAEYRQTEGAYKLLANPTYFKGTVIVKDLQSVNTPAESRVPALQQGTLDLTNTADASAIDLFKGDAKIAVHESDPLSIVRLAVNTEKEPVNRKEVRQAISYAIDKATIAEVITKGKPIPGNPGVVPPSSPWYNSGVKQYPFNPAKAKELLGNQPIKIELIASNSYREPELLQPMLAAVGITLEIKRVDSATQYSLLREGNFQLAEVQHIGIGGDPDYLRRWYAGEEANDAAQGSIFKNAEFDRISAQSATVTDPAARRELANRMQAILAEEVPTIPLYHRRFYWIYNKTTFSPVVTWGGLMNGIPFPQNKLAFLNF